MIDRLWRNPIDDQQHHAADQQRPADQFRTLEEVGLDVAVLNEPIAKITYNNFNKTFDYDYNYTAKINNNIKKLYAEYYRLQKQKKSKK